MSIGKGIVILGATSTIAMDVARQLAEPGRSFVLVARNGSDLEVIAEDLRTRGSAVYNVVQDLADFNGHEKLMGIVKDTLGESLHTVLLSYGALGDQEREERDINALRYQLDVNFTSAASLLTLVANELESRGVGQIVAISSVAGDRGRSRNYVYGAAKAGLTTFLSGLRQRLATKGVGVLTVLPGFVATKMTQHLQRTPLFASSEVVAKNIVKAMEANRNIIYTPWFWYGIMMVIRNIPEGVFKRVRV